MKAHISELNLHAEAQAKEYKQKVIIVIVFNKMFLDVILVIIYDIGYNL